MNLVTLIVLFLVLVVFLVIIARDIIYCTEKD